MTLLYWAMALTLIWSPAGLVLLLCWLWKAPADPEFMARLPRVQLRLWAYCAVLLIFPAFWTSPHPLLHGVGALGRYLLPAYLWFLLGARFGERETQRTVIKGLIAGALGLSALSLLGLLLRFLPIHATVEGSLVVQWHGSGPGSLRAQGLDMNANVLGALLVLLLPVGFYALRTAQADAAQTVMKSANRLKIGLGFMLWGGAIVASGSRNALLGLVFCLLLWRYGFTLPGRRSRRGALSGVLGGVLGSLLGILVLLGLWLRLEQLLHWHSASAGWFTGRFQVFAVGLSMWCAYPLTGMGILSVERLYPLFYTGWPQVAHLHNAFLQVAVESGLPAMLVLSTLVGATIFKRWRSNTLLHRTQAISLTVLVALSLGDHVLLDFRVLFVVLVLTALKLTSD